MEKLSEFAERIVSEVGAPSFNERERARDLIKEIAGHAWAGKGDMVDRVHDAVRRIYPRPTWTRRRIRSFWHREAAAVRWSEMRELEVVAEFERANRIRKEAAKAEHNGFIEYIANTLDRMEIADAEFHREHRRALRQMAIGSIDPSIGDASGSRDQSAAAGSRFFSSDEI